MEQNKTKFVHSITFEAKAGKPQNQKWFDGTIPLNPGLVAIIGNKGSGKSALADILGFLGHCKQTTDFSFLNTERFRHPKNGFASYFRARIEWESGEDDNYDLNESRPPEAVERIRYLPQNHIEKVCNGLIGIGEDEFDHELKSVIFSHVPEVLRLNQSTLNELVHFQTNEKQRRIDSLSARLRDSSRSRALLESQLSPEFRLTIEQKLRQRIADIESHNKLKPVDRVDPTAMPDTSAQNQGLLSELANVETQKASIEMQIATALADRQRLERRKAVAERLREKLLNFEKEYRSFLTGLEDDANELQVSPMELVTVEVRPIVVEAIIVDATARLGEIMSLMDKANPHGYVTRLESVDAQIIEIRSRLDAPQRAYQSYLADLAAWVERARELKGDSANPESRIGLEATLADLDNLPNRIAAEKSTQLVVAAEIFAEKVDLAEVFRKLYGPVQEFIDTHPLAKDKLSLEFQVELAAKGFASSFLNLLDLSRKGSFRGAEDGRTKAEGLAQNVNWDDLESVNAFLQNVDDTLCSDTRDNPSTPVQVSSQLVKGVKAEEVFDLVYGLKYLQPRYFLRWEGRDLSILSAGERGMLLLVFYLLIDKGDMPLIIDQPEGNLDNHTITKVLVDCIREARKKRQVFIVTHNPNLAVVCDADQVIHAQIDKRDGNKITYTSGSLENPIISKFLTDVLEGTRKAFDMRDAKYKVGVV